jgi:predicted flap endonuclease-1-like 5' DNA nuclease
MTYLIVEILAFLAVAALIGFVTAWSIRGGRAAASATAEGEASWTHRMTVAEADFEAKALEAEADNARLRADLHAAESRAALLQAEGGKRFGDLEAALRTQARAAEALAAERSHQLDQMRNTFNTANSEWRARIAMSDREIARLNAALEAVEATSVAEREGEQRVVVLEAEKEALAQRVRELEMALTDAAPASTDAAPHVDVSALQARIAELEAALGEKTAVPRKAARPAPPPGEDDLQTISGIGPVLEKALKSHGIVTYRALAALTADEAKALGARMKSNFADKLVRDRWQDQARAQHKQRYGDDI